LVLALGLRACVFETFTVTGKAMLPSVFPGDTVIASKVSYGVRVPGSGALLIDWGDIERGDLVILANVGDPPMTLIRRVVGVPGDEILVDDIEISYRPYTGKQEDKTPWTKIPCESIEGTNSYCLQEFNGRKAWVRGIERDASGNPQGNVNPTFKGAGKLDEEHVFVAADDRRDGQDSRRFGPVHINKIVGKVTRLWIPTRDFSKLEVNERVKALAKDRRYLGRL